MVDSDGTWWVIFQGHNLDAAAIEHKIPSQIGQPDPGQVLILREQWLRFVPRIKWCANLDGFACDQEGEWHGQWTEVQPNPATPHAQFTTARWGNPEPHNHGAI